MAPNHIESRTGRLFPVRTVAEDGVTSPKHRFRRGQILYSKIRPYLAKVTIAPFDGLCSADMYPVETILDPRYLQYWMLTREFTRLAADEQARTVLPKINRKALEKLPVPVAPQAEQRRIVEFLEDHLSRLSTAAAALATSGARTRALEEGAILDNLLPGWRTGGLESVLAGSTVGDSDRWRWVQLGEVAQVVGGLTKDAKRQADKSLTLVPYLRVANVQRARLDLADVATIRTTPEKALSLRLVAGDVLMNEGGDRDKLARGWVWNGQIPDCIHQNHVFRARPDRGRVRPEWLAWCANSYGARWAQRHGRQSVNLASIGLATIQRMPIPLPALEVQDTALLEIHRVREAVSALDKAAAAASRRLANLRQSLLAAAFSGHLTSAAPALGLATETPTT